jgi:hypothetical protein
MPVTAPMMRAAKRLMTVDDWQRRKFFFVSGKKRVGWPLMKEVICLPLNSGRSGSSFSKECVPHLREISFSFLFQSSRKTMTLGSISQ